MRRPPEDNKDRFILSSWLPESSYRRQCSAPALTTAPSRPHLVEYVPAEGIEAQHAATDLVGVSRSGYYAARRQRDPPYAMCTASMSLKSAFLARSSHGSRRLCAALRAQGPPESPPGTSPDASAWLAGTLEAPVRPRDDRSPCPTGRRERAPAPLPSSSPHQA